MPQCKVTDTFPTFTTLWEQVQHEPIEAQIDAWASAYMSQWPELLEKQVEDYASEGKDWRQIARERVFPFLSSRLSAMQTAHHNLLESCAPLYTEAQEKLDLDADVNFVIYVGIGCGAGWATTFDDTPAVLFGLENIAECGWGHPPALTGLIAHELGHLVHFHWREKHTLPKGSGPWWQLYSEGFAQRCEHLVLGKDTWHMNNAGDGQAWLDWCHDQKSWLAQEFLRVVDAGESVHLFFGSWFDIQGRRQCGYFLGHELIKQLEKRKSMKEIALLEGQTASLRRELERFADND